MGIIKFDKFQNGFDLLHKAGENSYVQEADCTHGKENILFIQPS